MDNGGFGGLVQPKKYHRNQPCGERKNTKLSKKKHFKLLSVLQKYTTFRFSSLVYDLKALLSGRKVTETIQSQVSTYFYFVKKVIFAMWKRGPGIEHML